MRLLTVAAPLFWFAPPRKLWTISARMKAAFPKPRLVARCLGSTLLSLALLVAASSHVAAANRHWTGAQSVFWTVAQNWSNNVAPVAGDNLFFPTPAFAGSTVSNFNNFASGTTFSSLTINSGSQNGHVLAGARITLTNGITATGNQFSFASTIGNDLTLGADQVFSATRTLSFSGTTDLNGKTLTIAPSGNIIVNGAIIAPSTGNILKTNSGTLTVNPGGRLEPLQMRVLNGTLRMDGTATNAQGVGIEVRSLQGTAMLTGTGVWDRVYAPGNGIISPAGTAAGLMQANYFNTYSTYCIIGCGNQSGIVQVDLNGTTAGTGYDQISVYGFDLDVANNTDPRGQLDVRVGYAAQVGDSFDIIRVRPGNPYGYTFHGGVFANLPYDSMLDLPSGFTFGVSYPDGTNGVTLTTLRSTNSPFALWQGTSGARNWSVPQNWAQGVAPANGTHVQLTRFQYRAFSYFAGSPVLTPAPPHTNDFVTLSVASLLLADTNHVVYGNGISVAEGITNRASGGTNSCFLDIAVSGPVNVAVEAGGTLQLGRSINGSGTVRKEGAGELLYTGTTLSSFVGSFVVNAGTFRVNGSISDGSFTVNGGTLAGTGTVSAVTMNAGVLSPGASTGVLRVQGDLVMNGGAAFQVELNGAIAGSSYDQLQVNGAVNLNGATLNLQPNFSANPGAAFLVLANDGSDAISGTFNGLPEGKVFPANGQFFSITYRGGSGSNDVVITRVTPPSSWSSVTRLSPGAVRLEGMGASNANYTVQANTNLNTTNWINISTVPSDGSGRFIFTDSNVLSFPRRFFRAVGP